MITVSKTTDLDYIKRTINEPGMRKRLTEDIVVTPNEDAVLSNPNNLCFAVTNKETDADCGFIIYTPIDGSNWYSMHMCLKGLGMRSQLAAADECSKLAMMNGAPFLITAFPEKNIVLKRMIEWSRWKRIPNFIAQQFYNPMFTSKPVFYILNNNNYDDNNK